jgi:hypothetical protein
MPDADQHDPVDVAGRPIAVGDVVRIIGVPDLSRMTPECRAESQSVFEYLVGKYKSVASFDDYGCVEIAFEIRKKGPHRGLHLVWIEPELLRVRQQRERI